MTSVYFLYILLQKLDTEENMWRQLFVVIDSQLTRPSGCLSCSCFLRSREGIYAVQVLLRNLWSLGNYVVPSNLRESDFLAVRALQVRLYELAADVKASSLLGLWPWNEVYIETRTCPTDQLILHILYLYFLEFILNDKV